MIRSFLAAVAALGCVSACGGETAGDGPRSASGLPDDQPLSQLSPSERETLCDTYIELLGGDGHVYDCDDGRFVVDRDDMDCLPLPSGCTAVVLDAEACAREYADAFAACEDPKGRPACERFADLCSGDDGEVVPSDSDPGSQQDGGYTVTPTPPDPSCVPGEMASCACADGREGVQTCQSDGTAFAPCECQPSPSGSCDPAFCPSSGGGAPCCASPNGPCGVDLGTGCQSLAPG